MTKAKTNRRDGAALVVSAIAHVAIIAILVSQAAPKYALPEPPPAPPMDIQIITAPEIPPPPIVPPKMVPRKIETTPPPPAPAPPVPKPTPAPPKPVQAKPTPPKAPTVVVTPTPPKPATPQAQPAPPKPVPPKLAPPSPPTAIAAPAKLNIHKPKEDAPANVATLPMAPSSSAPSAPGASAGAVQAPGSRLSGLIPFPGGSMPSSGTGLRGTLVGCANAESVRLSSVERAHCNERFGVEMARAPGLDGINPSKRAAYDKAAAAQDRSLHAGLLDPIRAIEERHGRPTDFGGGVVTGPASTYDHP